MLLWRNGHIVFPAELGVSQPSNLERIVRIPQRIGEKGSLKWVQASLAHTSNPLESAIREELKLSSAVSIEWRSPRSDDDNAEYRDGAFLQRLGLERLEADLKAFWPRLGPQWDALAVASDGKVILVEAKAHASELASSCTAGVRSRGVIDRALQAAKKHFGARPGADWATGYYQYANRLAHLQFLRDRGVDAHLVFVYFLRDRDMRGPKAAEEWGAALDECYSALGLPDGKAVAGLHSLFIDVDKLDGVKQVL